MTDQEIEKLVEKVARKVVSETKKQMMLQSVDKMAERDAADMLRTHFHSIRSKKVEKVLQEISYDAYYQIIILHYKENVKLEQIAEKMNVDVSTVSRNKKRLLRLIYKKLM